MTQPQTEPETQPPVRREEPRPDIDDLIYSWTTEKRVSER